MAIGWWGKVYGTFTCIIGHYMQKWNFQDFPQMSEPWGEKSIIFHHVKAKSELKNFRWHPAQSDWGVNHLSTFDLELRNVSFELISFMEFPAILCALQPFQICIHKRKYSKLTFSNGSQLMGKRFMAHLHASLESTCKSRTSKISTRCQNQEGKVNHLSPCPG